jgi:hypothetical protein
LLARRGFDFLARVAREMDARGLPFKLLIVGGNRNPSVEKEVQGMFDPLRKQGKVIFTGFKIGEDLAEAYACGDVFLHCSITETFGLVVLESMASGVPVVARDEGGPSDIVQHGDTGFLVPPDDLDGFVAKATKLALDHALRSQMAVASRAAACEATWEKINNKVAWRMADTIAENERERAGKVQDQLLTPASLSTMGQQQEQLVPIFGWLMMNDAVRGALTRSIVDARLLGGLGVILSCWAVTGLYMVFTECLLWCRGRMRAGERKIVA